MQNLQEDDDMVRQTHSKSKGHMFFAKGTDNTTYEFYKVGGNIYKAPVSNVMDLSTKARIGRFEGPGTKEYTAYIKEVWKGTKK
jgi:hypothetical protein